MGMKRCQLWFEQFKKPAAKLCIVQHGTDLLLLSAKSIWNRFERNMSYTATCRPGSWGWRYCQQPGPLIDKIPSKVELDSGWSSARASPKINSFKCSPVAKRLCAHVLRSPKTINGPCWCNRLIHLSLVRNIPAAYHPPFCVLAHALWNEFFHFRSCELFKCSKLQKRNWMTWPVASRSSHL